ncbi:MAG: hypothetical protein HZB41_05760, partial [Ignavibacteriae bacterium]|nr:hypothetical protein [Ignavibacteriota bacterium]
GTAERTTNAKPFNIFGLILCTFTNPLPALFEILQNFVIFVILSNILIIDIMGNVVKTLVNRELNPGHYEIILDVNDIPSGCYYYILQTPTTKITRQLNVHK